MRFSECLEKIIEDRIESTNDEIAKEQWYIELRDKLIVLQDNQSSETMSVLNDCNEINYGIYSQTMKRIYRQAFIDGVETGGIMAPILAPKY